MGGLFVLSWIYILPFLVMGFECKTFACLFVWRSVEPGWLLSSNEPACLALTHVNLECAPQWDCYSSLYLYYFSLLLWIDHTSSSNFLLILSLFCNAYTQDFGKQANLANYSSLIEDKKSFNPTSSFIILSRMHFTLHLLNILIWEFKDKLISSTKLWDQNRKNIPFRLRVLHTVKFLFVLFVWSFCITCVQELPELEIHQDVLPLNGYRWEAHRQEVSMSECILAPDWTWSEMWWIIGFAFLSLCKMSLWAIF